MVNRHLHACQMLTTILNCAVKDQLASISAPNLVAVDPCEQLMFLNEWTQIEIRYEDLTQTSWFERLSKLYLFSFCDFYWGLTNTRRDWKSC